MHFQTLKEKTSHNIPGKPLPNEFYTITGTIEFC